MQEEAVQLTPDGHPNKPHCLSSLGGSLHRRFECLGNITDINNSIRVGEDAVRLTPDSHPRKPHCLDNLSGSLLLRFQHFGKFTDINNSIRMQEDAVRLIPDGHPDKPDHLDNLGGSLLHRFEWLGNITDMDNSIRMLEDAVQLTPDGHPKKPIYLSNLGCSLLHRFIHLGNIPNIDNSIRMQEDAVQLIPDGHIEKPCSLDNLGASLRHRFERLGSITDLDNSIRILEDAVRLTPDSHPEKPMSLENLGGTLLCRFVRLHNITDIDNSIRVREDAVQLTPDGHPNKPACLSNLGGSLHRRFERLGNITDINNSIRMQEDAVRLTPDSHLHKPHYLSSLSSSLLHRFEHLGNITDIENSIKAAEDAVQLTPDGHPNKSSRLNNLGGSLLRRFERLSNITDMDNSIRMQENAVQLIPDGHPDKPISLINLGHVLLRHFVCFGDQANFELAIKALSTAAQSNVGSPSQRFQAGIAWAQWAKETHHTSLLTAYSTSLTLLPQLAWLGLPMHERHRELTEAGNLARDAASAAIEAGQFETAIEWLEQGRSVVWGQLLQLRTPINELQQVQPQLAARFTQVSNQLQQTSTPSYASKASDQHSLEEVAQEHRWLTAQWEAILGEIRGIQGFDRFLLSKPFLQLKGVVHSGPVIILNASTTCCDALVMLPDLDDILHIPLHTFTESDAQGLHNQLKTLLSESGRLVPSDRGCRRKEFPDPNSLLEEVLAQLWEHVVKPVLDGLAFTSPPHANNLSRIWWCPNGPLAFLPIHAAGIYSTSEPGNCISDFVISSYTPTLSALINGHISTVKTVLECMQQSNWVHFACHGVQEHENPMDSGLLLEDGCLKLSAIIDQILPNAELAFLSACQTAAGTADLSEESVHLAAGMLLAGYRGVVATMWSIGDNDAPRVADSFYAHVLGGEKLDHTQAAFGLHQAVQRLRSGGASFLSWVPFIHIGA
ncbi:hypothetical protein JAAARDRAFT_200953 [Jaapia argillacea MUCL 33604]|uniref:CHAT domain-containing protein n=1 Tax=Jaapia argillacea MUCL 33604 TaxID=933084 RepID=A0A067PE66_9AGAM|nr:hypothetical protein JAAARDRAFT_200953 [Jaapia argillacea MUCL 33604]